MYRQHFGLSSDPFSIAPDPRFLFMSAAHREALGHLVYGLQGGGGFVLLTGEIGTGKTTICRAFLEQIPEGVRVGYVLNPRVDPAELLQTVCEEFHVAVRGTGMKAQVDALNAHLLAHHARGGRSVLVIDEAQNLSRVVLEQLRLLTNLETAERKLLQIILIGQPELRDKLASPRLEQLGQRVIARYHLGPLDREDSQRYIAHRLAVAGHHGELPFDRGALRALHRLSGGVPRRLNLLADRALLGAYSAGTTRVGAAIVRRAAAEVFGPELRRGPDPRWTWAAGAAGLVALVAAAVWINRSDAVSTAAATPPASAPAAAPASAAISAVAAVDRGLTATAPEAPPAASASQLSSTATMLPDLPAVHDEASGWLALARMWGEATTTPCAADQAGSLRCYRAAQFTLAQVRQLDRPGLVTLREDGAARTALLLGVDGAGVLLQQGARREALDAARFGQRWAGDFATLWRVRGAPESRASAEWMAAQLQGLAPAPAAAGESASERVKSFQRAQGLVADGVPGSLTLMQLNRALGVDEPRLLH